LTVPEAGYAGFKNGELLRRASGSFDLFITTDKNLRHQQNLSAFAMGFILIRAHTNDIADIEPLVPQLLAMLPDTRRGTLRTVG